MAKWLYSLGGINVKAFNHYALSMSFILKKTEIIKWLCSIEKEYNYYIIYDTIVVSFLEEGNWYKESYCCI